jgi:TctA family transporter
LHPLLPSLKVVWDVKSFRFTKIENLIMFLLLHVPSSHFVLQGNEVLSHVCIIALWILFCLTGKYSVNSKLIELVTCQTSGLSTVVEYKISCRLVNFSLFMQKTTRTLVLKSNIYWQGIVIFTCPC